MVQQQPIFQRSHLRPDRFEMSERRSVNSMECDELNGNRRLHRDTDSKVVNSLEDMGESEQRLDESTRTTLVNNKTGSSAAENHSNRGAREEKA